jgi:aryl-alcohol dehydrogenase-like predicted oxidoreductase
METRRIGGLTVSAVGLGTNQLGTRECDEASSARIVSEALDAGITYFDTADEYGRNYFDENDPSGWGRTEEYLGRALGARRDDVVIASKFGVRPYGDAERGGASAQWAKRALEDSLRRLGTDHLDLYQLHIPDPTVPIAETLGAMDAMVREGKVREIGCSNLSGRELEDANAVATEAGLTPFASIQSPLNLIQRGALADIMPVCERIGVSFIPYYPLASGILTGKYRRDRPAPTGSRISEQLDDATRRRILSGRTFDRIEALDAFARDRGHTLLELAIGWLLGHAAVPTVIAGAAKPGQATANAAAASWRLTPEEVSDATRVVEDATA